MHETSVLKTFSMPGFASTNPGTPSPELDEERRGEVRLKGGAGSVLEQRVCKSGVVESLGRERGLRVKKNGKRGKRYLLKRTKLVIGILLDRDRRKWLLKRGSWSASGTWGYASPGVLLQEYAND